MSKQNFDMHTFNLKKLTVMEAKEYHIKISNRFAALEKLR
jgi:hypothetical protein